MSPKLRRSFDDPNRTVPFDWDGAVASNLRDVTFKTLLQAWRMHRVTDVCGEPLDEAFDVTKARAALKDPSDVQRQSLKLEGRPR